MGSIVRTVRALVAVAGGVAATFAVSGPASAAAASIPVCSTYLTRDNVVMPSGPSNNLHCWLQQGHTGNGVKALQYALDKCYGPELYRQGFPRIAEDSNFGPITRAALKQVQKENNITQDGIYGWETAHYMNFYSTDGICRRMP